MDHQKYAAIKDILGTGNYAVTEYSDGRRGIWQFQILQPRGPSPLVALTDEFVDDLSVEEIVNKFGEWEVMKRASEAPTKMVVVTKTGVEIWPRGIE